MSIGSFLLGFALLILVGLFLARPFIAPEKKERRLSRRQAVAVKKEAILDQIRSLDFDFETGKIPDEVYQPQRAYLLAEAAAAAKELDETALPPGQTVPVEPAGQLDDDLEAIIARYRRGAAPVKAATSNGHGRFCTQCGQPSDAGDKFCAKCGHQLPA